MNGRSSYIGRFAPSPSGLLHFGSLIAALASYLDAKANNGLWLLRMEDLDPAREPEGTAEQILNCLDQLSLHWDGEVVYQSDRLDAYAEALHTLRSKELIYSCDCTRQQVQAMGGVYDNRCRTRSDKVIGGAIRLQTAKTQIHFTDSIQGEQSQDVLNECGDFVLVRKDELFAYQLAVVVDDEFQGITDVVRGFDLLDSTPRQIYLQQCLGYPQPRYAHIPVAVNSEGQKLSKQHFADAIDPQQASQLLYRALLFLGQQPDPGLQSAEVEDLLAWAIAYWDIQAVPKLANILHESV
ncbi:MAG: tRNA glutamyl-Q(34) synthetase GluQRS [Gammaproteobacteria bacterium]